MYRFHFHLHSPDQFECDDTGIVFADVENAYLEACRAIPDLAADLLRERKNPLAYELFIENDRGEILMVVPFTELIKAPSQADTHTRAEGKLDVARRRVRESRARIVRQRQIVDRLQSLQRDARLALSILHQFERSHAVFRQRLARAEREAAQSAWKARRRLRATLS